MQPGTHAYTRCCLVGLLLALPALRGTLPARAARTPAVAVTSFYAASAQAYIDWHLNHYAPPLVQPTFTTGTSGVAFFVAFSSPVPLTGLAVVLRGQGGTLQVRPAWQTVPGSSIAMTALSTAAGAFPNGTYAADLLLGGRMLAGLIVHIGGAVGGVTISAFRVSTVAAVGAWARQSGFYPLPAGVRAFPSGTRQVGSIFLFKGAVPNVTAEQIVVDGPHGLRVTSGAPYTVQHSSNGIYEYLSAPPPLAYPNGAYAAVVLIDGLQAAQTVFTVG